jgi:hypothetical protein
MKQAPFEAAHGEQWRAFERFLDAGAPPPFAPEEMPQRYRRLCQHLALATDRQYSPELANRSAWRTSCSSPSRRWCAPNGAW